MNIAVIGASRNKDKYSNKAIRAYLRRGDNVFPVNPKYDYIENLKCYKSINDIEENIDVLLMYVNSDVGINLIDEIVKKKVKTVFLNPGSESEVLEKQLKETGIEVITACNLLVNNINLNDY